MPDLKRQTIDDFGEQWTAFRDSPGYYGSAELLADLFGPLLTLDDVKSARVADIGSGTGRIVNMLLDAGADRVVAVEPSAAFEVLKTNTVARADRIDYLQVPGDQLPSRLDLDYVVSMGVLHHIPAPSPVVRAAFGALRPGGRCIVWLYGFEGNQTYLSIAIPLRKVTVRMPHGMLVALSHLLEFALTTYIGLCRILPLPMRNYIRSVLARFPRSVRRLTIYDQLNPSYAKYYTRDEAQALLSDAGFAGVELYHRHGYSWTVSGTRLAQSPDQSASKDSEGGH
ncbi:class I SAM-dependent methyltransferase [Bradyrhizobium japonicum]|uniref:class I SAM-dependent methyltransferase n=1 Tax=Bradyrhizobium japonicum TaxID=375 RepID=UPI001B8A48BF|nr:class I SAM-dependent methyltransferase [Bradyrhizobium japonicum]MBR0974393.1 class I SAM-dependent methyltransferase [Bradyrhizobium japonicum]